MEQQKAVYLDDRQVSHILSIARQTLANWRAQHKGPPYVKSGRLVRYAINDVLTFMEARKIGTNDQPIEEE